MLDANLYMPLENVDGPIAAVGEGKGRGYGGAMGPSISLSSMYEI